MALTLQLSPDLETRFAKEAAVQGMPIEKYAISVLEQGHPAVARREELAAELQAWPDAKQAPVPSLVNRPATREQPASDSIRVLATQLFRRHVACRPDHKPAIRPPSEQG